MMYRVIVTGLLVLVTLSVLGCGDSGAQATLEEFMDASMARDCATMVDLFDSETYPDGTYDRDEEIKACSESFTGDVESYQIIKEEIDGDSATFEVEMQNRYDAADEIVSETYTFTIVKRDDGWKVSSAR